MDRMQCILINHMLTILVLCIISGRPNGKMLLSAEDHQQNGSKATTRLYVQEVPPINRPQEINNYTMETRRGETDEPPLGLRTHLAQCVITPPNSLSEVGECSNGTGNESQGRSTATSVRNGGGGVCSGSGGGGSLG